jgi:hypothetical protein
MLFTIADMKILTFNLLNIDAVYFCAYRERCFPNYFNYVPLTLR